MSQPHALVVAGPNGAGKTTLAMEYLAAHPLPYVSVDLIADELAGGDDDVRIEAGRVFFDSLDAQILTGRSFLTEATLAGRTFRRVIERLRSRNFRISIAFVFLTSEEACVARVQERVRKGGHSIPEQDVRRRFLRSCRNFWHKYRPLVDRWHLFYNGGIQFHEVAVGVLDATEILDEALYEAFLGIVRESTHE